MQPTRTDQTITARTILIMVILGVLLGALVGTALVLQSTQPALNTAPALPATPAPVCQEDMPCWDCTTMGNLICGPVPDAPAWIDTPWEDYLPPPASNALYWIVATFIK